MTLYADLIHKVQSDFSDSCWIWENNKTHDGYGLLRVEGKMAYSHVTAYMVRFGYRPEAQLDHLCSNRDCYNPNHLEPVTAIENNHRAVNGNFLKTHCKYGHEFTPENTYWWYGRKHQYRRCKACNLRIAKERYHKKLVSS